MLIHDIADVFGFKPDLLEKELSLIKAQYAKRLEGYNSYRNQSEVNALISDTSKGAKDLAHYLNSLPIDVKEALNSMCLCQIIANSTVKGDDSDLNSNSKEFIDDTIRRLKKIERATSTLDIYTFGQKKMHHRTWLVKDLKNSWKSLSDTSPSKSSGTNLFVDYMELACEYMGIDSKGLRRNHLNTD